MKADYEKRIQALEEKLSSLQGGVPPAQQPETQVPQTPLPPEQVPAASTGLQGGQISNAKAFNPDIAVIGDFLGAAGSNEVNPSPAMEMHESELALQAIVDPYARADFFFSFGENGVALEEGYITFPAIPGGLLVKVGKMRAAFGKVNTLHNHVLPWTDRPHRDRQPGCRRRGHQRCGIFSRAVDFESVDLPGSDRAGLPGRFG